MEGIHCSAQRSAKGHHSPLTPVMGACLCRYLSAEDMQETASLLTVTSVRGPAAKAPVIPPTVLGKHGMESVADVTGTALPAMFEYKHTGSCSIVNRIFDMGSDGSLSVADACVDEVEDMLLRAQQGAPLQPADFAQLAGVYSMLQSKFSARQVQVGPFVCSAAPNKTRVALHDAPGSVVALPLQGIAPQCLPATTQIMSPSALSLWLSGEVQRREYTATTAEHDV